MFDGRASSRKAAPACSADSRNPPGSTTQDDQYRGLIHGIERELLDLTTMDDLAEERAEYQKAYQDLTQTSAAQQKLIQELQRIIDDQRDGWDNSVPPTLYPGTVHTNNMQSREPPKRQDEYQLENLGGYERLYPPMKAYHVTEVPPEEPSAPKLDPLAMKLW